MINETPLGTNIRKMKPYNVMIVVDSISEKKLLQQHFKAAEFNPLSMDEEITAYLVNKIAGSQLSEEPILAEAEEELKEKEEARMNQVFAELAKVDILCIEFKLNASSSAIIYEIQIKFPKMIIILIVNNVRKELLDEMLKTKADAYLAKPITKNTIYDKLKIILKRQDLIPKEVIGYKPKGINLNEIQIPPLSQVLSQVMMFDNDKAGGSEELEEIVSPDKSLSADLMRIANSAFYGRMGSIRTLREAITLIGLKTINNIAIVKARRMFTQKLKQPIFYKYLDEFPILTGLIALDLSAPLHLTHLNNQIFIHSVLYKIGMTILAINLPPRYANLLQLFEQGPKTIIQLEREEFNTDYIHLGVKIFKTWQLPLSMQEVVRNQEFTLSEINGVNDLDRLLRIANILALKLLGIRNDSEMKLLVELLKRYNVNKDLINLFNDEYYTHIKSHPFFDAF